MSVSSLNFQITLEEYISTLKHSLLPTLIVEGNDDLLVFRNFESNNLSILPVGGRKNVLDLFERSSEFRNVKHAFIADQDTWINLGIPAKYKTQHLILTSGYSIENDIIVDGNILDLMNAIEKSNFNTELELFLCWYATNLDGFLKGNGGKFKSHPNSILDDPAFRNELREKLNTRNYPIALYDNLLANYTLSIRGKSLFGLIIRQLSYPGRPVRHNSKALMEYIALNPKELLTRIKTEIDTVFST